jgi:branched-subunit amino acid aminotransferase/4-amino-4-deoxychorismate lyase
MLVWLNGKLIERDDATISALDAGLQHGIGLFETFAAHHGTVFRAEAHTRRLVQSARELLLSETLRAQPLAEAVKLTLKRNELERARVRLTVTGGNLNVLASRDRPRRVDPTILIDVQPPTIYPDAFFEQGIMVTIAEGRLNPLSPTAGHKTLDYWPRIHALQHAAAAKGGEALWFTTANHLASGSVSNVFLARGGALHTPFARGESPDDPAGRAVLPGITRAAILELCDALTIETVRRTLDVNDLLSADEVFLSNSSWGVLPVVAVEKEKIGNGEVGDMATRLRQAWLDLVERETAP